MVNPPKRAFVEVSRKAKTFSIATLDNFPSFCSTYIVILIYNSVSPVVFVCAQDGLNRLSCQPAELLQVTPQASASRQFRPFSRTSSAAALAEPSRRSLALSPASKL